MPTANDHQYTYATKVAVKVRVAPSTGANSCGAIGAAQPVYADEAPVKGTDGFLWVHSTIGWIRGDLLELKYQKAPSPIDPPAMPPDMADALELLQVARGHIDKAIGLIRKG